MGDNQMNVQIWACDCPNDYGRKPTTLVCERCDAVKPEPISLDGARGAHSAASLAEKLLRLVAQLGHDVPVRYRVAPNTPLEVEQLAKFIDCNKTVRSTGFAVFHTGEELKTAYIMIGD